MKYFKLNQTVYHPIYGEGKVVEGYLDKYPISVKFENYRIDFTQDGRETESSKVTLSQNPIPEIVNKSLEDTYIPFTFENDLLGMKVKYKSTKEKMFITYQSEDDIQCGGLNYSYHNLLEDFEFLDGKPCGKLGN